MQGQMAQTHQQQVQQFVHDEPAASWLLLLLMTMITHTVVAHHECMHATSDHNEWALLPQPTQCVLLATLSPAPTTAPTTGSEPDPPDVTVKLVPAGRVGPKGATPPVLGKPARQNAGSSTTRSAAMALGRGGWCDYRDVDMHAHVLLGCWLMIVPHQRTRKVHSAYCGVLEILHKAIDPVDQPCCDATEQRREPRGQE